MDGTDSIKATPVAERCSEYSAEVLCAGWAPELSVVAGSFEGAPRVAIPPPVAETEAFLSRYYRAQGT